jgi:hypothetical protein
VASGVHAAIGAARGLSRASSTAGMSTVSSVGSGNSEQLEELTSLCRQLVEEQRELRHIIDQQGQEILANKRGGSPVRRGRSRVKSSHSSSNHDNKERGGRSRSRSKGPSKRAAGGVGFGSTVPRMVADRGAKKRGGGGGGGGGGSASGESSSVSPNRRAAHERRMQGGEATRSTRTRAPRGGVDRPSKEERKKALKGYKPSKDDLRRQKERRIKIRQEYAKRTRFRPKGAAGDGGGGGGGGYDSKQRAPEQRSVQRNQAVQREQARAQRLAEVESYVDDRPIRGMVGNAAAQLDSESHMIHNYERKRNPLKLLASGTGNTPRGPMGRDPYEGSHANSNSSRKKQWRKPAEHFEFKEEF